MLTYRLFKTQTMLLSTTSTKGQPDANLPTVQNQEHTLVTNKHKGPARCLLTNCSKHRACSCQQQAGRASWMLTYILFKTQTMLLSTKSTKSQPDADLLSIQTQSMLLSATSRKGQPDADLQSFQKPKHTSVSRKG
jgi:hypothetical protein